MRKALPAGAIAIAAGVVMLPQLAPAQPAQTAATKAKLQLQKDAAGSFVVDGTGRTLYMFAKDTSRRSACSGACAKAWPPYVTSGKPTAGKGVSASKIGTIRRKNGRLQATYGGHPLYRYAGDTSAGQTNGQGSNGFGAKWWLLGSSGKPRTSSPTMPDTGGVPDTGSYY